MAKSYYKFDKRPDKVTVDWGAISKDFSTRLSEERNRREDLKSEIAEDTKKYLRTVQDTPQGQNQSANDRMASFAEAATKTRLMQEQKLKSGELKLRDYYAQKANLEQGTTDLFEVAKNFNTNFEKNMQRANTNASQVEIWNNGRLQDFANPAKSQIIVDHGPITTYFDITKPAISRQVPESTCDCIRVCVLRKSETCPNPRHLLN